MNSINQLSVPKEFANFYIHLQNSSEETAVITPVGHSPLLHESKFGGNPYLPKNSVHPKDDYGQYMLLLAQINFSKIQLGPDFPNFGILQFYISQQCYQNQQLTSRYKVCYFSTVLDENKLVSDFSYLQQVDYTHFPIKKELNLQFPTITEPVSATDYRLSYYFNPSLFKECMSIDGYAFSDFYLEHFLSAEHKIGGYSYFIEKDFRENCVPLQCYDTLLLQIVSNDGQGLCGVIVE